MAMSRTKLPMLLRAYLFFGTLVLVGVGIVYTTSLITRLNAQSRALSNLFARFCAVATLPATDNPEMRQIFADVVRPADFPMILTDENGQPRVWKLPVAVDSL